MPPKLPELSGLSFCALRGANPRLVAGSSGSGKDIRPRRLAPAAGSLERAEASFLPSTLISLLSRYLYIIHRCGRRFKFFFVISKNFAVRKLRRPSRGQPFTPCKREKSGSKKQRPLPEGLAVICEARQRRNKAILVHSRTFYAASHVTQTKAASLTRKNARFLGFAFLL